MAFPSSNGDAMRQLREEKGHVAVCRHWAKKGDCMYHQHGRCGFAHNEADRGSLMVTDQAARRTKRGKSKRNRVYNDGRAASLRRWCVRTFGAEFMGSGTGVLDVAGGKGELAFELLALNGFQTTVVDPRQMNTNRYQRKLEFDYYHKNEVLNAYNTRERPAPGALMRPLHIRGMFQFPSRHLMVPLSADQSELSCAPCQPPDESIIYPFLLRDEQCFEDNMRDSRSMTWTHKGLHLENKDDEEGIDSNSNGVGGSGTEEQWGTEEGQGRFIPGIEVTDFKEARRLVGGASLVVGMHPDQGAEPLVDFALANGKPFALVPCCVYSKDFPKRKGPDGRLVRTYGELIEYLLAKDPGIKAAELDFEGKNILLYHLGGREPNVPPLEPALHVVRGPSGPEHWWALSTRRKLDKSKKRAATAERLGEIGAGTASRNKKIEKAMLWFDADAEEDDEEEEGGEMARTEGSDGGDGAEGVFASLFIE